MKKLLTFLLVALSFAAQSQVLQQPTVFGSLYKNLGSKNVMLLPTGSGEPAPLDAKLRTYNQGAIYIDKVGNQIYFWNPDTEVWINVSGAFQDGLISGGTVSWSGAGLTFDIQAAVFRIFGVTYYTRDTTITLDPADPTYSRIDLFGLDTTNGGEVIKITGTPSPTPIAPQTQDFQIALTTGITLNVGDTVPSNVSIQKIYDENIEWAIGTDRATVDFNNTTFPYTGNKDAFVSSYANIGRLVFARFGTGIIDGSEVLRFRIALTSPLRTKKLSIAFFHGATLSSNIIGISSNNGLNPNKINQYQTITIPVSYFQWSDYSYNRIILYVSDYDTSFVVPFYLDDMELQTGVNNIPLQTDYSRKVDSVVTRNDSSFYVIGKNYYYFKTGVGSGIDSASYHTLTVNSDTTGATLNRPNGTSDFIPLPFVKKTDSTVIKVHYPLWAFTLDSLGLRTDSMPKLEYAIAGRDTSTWDNQTLIDKQFLQDRISTGGVVTTIQTHTSGSTVTINDATTWLVINPTSALASLTVTLPASPTNGQLIDISFGGTINTTDATVVTNFLLVANTGQSLVGTGSYGQIVTEDHIAYRFISSLSKWYRN